MPTTHAFNVPNPYQAQLDEIARRQKLAEIMQAQAFQPAESSSYKGVQFTSPASHIAKLLQLGTGIWAADRASEERKEVGEKSARDMAEILKRGRVLEEGVPGEAAVPASVIPAYGYKPMAADLADKPDLEVDAAGMAINPAQAIPGSPAIPAIPPNLRGAAAEYMKHPALFPMGLSIQGELQKQEMAEAERQRFTREFLGVDDGAAPGVAPQGAPAGPTPLLPQGAVGGGTGYDNNLGNIRVSSADWEGKGEPYKGFETFDTPQSGANAMFKNLGAYVRQNPNITVAQAIAKWAPPNENDTGLYIRQVGEGTGINPGMPLAEVLKDPAVSAQLLDAITRKEKGGLPAGVTADTFMTATGGAPSVAGVVPVGLPAAAPPGVSPAGGAQAPAALAPPVFREVPRPEATLEMRREVVRELGRDINVSGKAAAALDKKRDDLWARQREANKADYEQKLDAYKNARSRAEKLPGERFSQADKLRGDYLAQQPVKDYHKAATVFRSAVQAQKIDSAASDLNMVYAFATLMDPGSVVRDQETGMIMATQNASDRVLELVKKVTGGSRLSKSARDALVNEMGSRYEAYRKMRDDIAGHFSGIAKRHELDASDVVIDVPRVEWGVEATGRQDEYDLVPGRGLVKRK